VRRTARRRSRQPTLLGSASSGGDERTDDPEEWEDDPDVRAETCECRGNIESTIQSTNAYAPTVAIAPIQASRSVIESPSGVGARRVPANDQCVEDEDGKRIHDESPGLEVVDACGGKFPDEVEEAMTTAAQRAVFERNQSPMPVNATTNPRTIEANPRF
jgi:hypothetical protein